MNKNQMNDGRFESESVNSKDNFKYHSLTPILLDTSSQSYQVYEKALDFAYEDPEIKNIAITGGYGVGKSSFLKTYFAENEHKKITVSIADFEDVSNNSNSQIKTAESQIINQILYQILPEEIPLSKFGVKLNKSKEQIWALRISIILLFIGIFLMFNINLLNSSIAAIFNKRYAPFCCLMVIIILILPSLIMFSRWISERLSPKNIRLNFKGAESDVIENDDTEILDKEMREIVYLILTSGVDTVIFEDLDRFNKIAPFIRLREINSLVNFQSENTIKFIYVVRDDLFEPKDRTKFFDFMIPIIPTVTTFNSPSKALKEFESVTYKIPSSDLQKIFIYIDDMRLLYSIKNEYEIYSKILKEKAYKTELFSLIVLKNVFPQEFLDLENDRGYLFEILNQKDVIINKYETALKKKIEEIEELKSIYVNNFSDYVAIHVPDTYEFIQKDKHESFSTYLANWFKNKNDRKQVKKTVTTYYWTLDEFLDDLFRTQKQDDFISKFDYVNYDDINIKISELEEQVEELNKKIHFSYKTQLGDLINELDQREQEEFFMEDNEEYQETTQNHYFPLIRFLILEGYVDENYRLYNNYFYKGELTRNDYDFLRLVRSNKPIDNNFKLYNIKEIMNHLDESDYLRKNIVNYDLLMKLIKNYQYQETINMFNIILETHDFPAFDYINHFTYETLQRLIDILTEKDNSIIKKCLQEIYLPSVLKMKIISLAYTVEGFEPTTDMNNYIETNIEMLDFKFIEDTYSLLTSFNEFDIKFRDVSELEGTFEIFNFLAKNLMFDPTLDNLMRIVKEISVPNHNESDFLSEFFFFLFNLNVDEIKVYVYKNLQTIVDEYLNRVIETDINIYSGQEAFIKILNSDIDQESKEEVISREITIIENLSDINDYNLWTKLFISNLVEYNRENLTLYHKEIGCLDEIIEYFNKNFKEAVELPNNLTQDLLQMNGLDLEYFKSISKQFKNSLEDFNEDLELERRSILIENNCLDLNLNNLIKVINTDQNELTKIYLHNSLEHSGYEKVSKLLFSDKVVEILSISLLEKILDSRILNEIDSIALIKEKNVKVSLFKVSNAPESVRKEILNNYFLETDLQKIVSEYEQFDLKEQLVIKMNDNLDWLFDLDIKDVPINLISALFESEVLTKKNKKDLFIEIVENEIYASQWGEWLKHTDFGDKISIVFSNKKPRITRQNNLESCIVNKLVDKEIISKDGNDRLHLREKKWTELLNLDKS